MLLQALAKTSHQIKKQHPNDMPEKSRSQLIILRNTRWVVRFGVLEVFCDAYNAAVVAICQYIVYEPSPWHSKSASKATLSSICVLHIPSSHGPTISIIFRGLFGSLRHSRCPSYVFVPDLVFAGHSVAYIQSTIASSSRLPQFVFLVASLQHTVLSHIEMLNTPLHLFQLIQPDPTRFVISVSIVFYTSSI